MYERGWVAVETALVRYFSYFSYMRYLKRYFICYVRYTWLYVRLTRLELWPRHKTAGQGASITDDAPTTRPHVRVVLNRKTQST